MSNYLEPQNEQLRNKVWTMRTTNLISAFCNPIDEEKLEIYTNKMREEMLSNNFPPILGYPGVIGEREIENETFLLNGDQITQSQIGQACWFVTDGHHRSLAAIEASVPYIECQLDYDCLTCETDLGLW